VITLNREALWFYRFGRISFGKPAAAFPENAPEARTVLFGKTA